MVSLARDVPNVVAVKDSTGDVAGAARLLTQTPSGFEIYCGDDDLALMQRALLHQHGGDRPAPAVEAAFDHPDDQVVRDESACIHDRLGLPAECRVASHLAAQHVPGGDVGNAEAHRHPGRLSPLAASGRPEHQGDHLMNPLYWRISNWVSICFMVSRATPTTIKIAVPPR